MNIISLLLMLAVIPALGNPQDIQSLDAITAAVRTFLGKLKEGEPPPIIVDALDPRLRLTACDTPLEVSLAAGARPTGRTVVAVHCPLPRPWSLYVPAKVAAPIFVVVATRNLARNQVLTAADIAVEQRDANDLPTSYLTDPNQIVGKVLARPATAGSVLSLGQAQAPVVVRRGDRVTLEVQTAGFEVRSSGVALGDAGLGERVSVRNENSRRVVEGTVKKAGIVTMDW